MSLKNGKVRCDKYNQNWKVWLEGNLFFIRSINSKQPQMKCRMTIRQLVVTPLYYGTIFREELPVD